MSDRGRGDPEIVRADEPARVWRAGAQMSACTRATVLGDRDRSRPCEQVLDERAGGARGGAPVARCTPCSSSLTVMTLIARSWSPSSPIDPGAH